MTGETTLRTLPGKTTITPGALWWRRFWIRLNSWEYWPVYIFNIPIIGIWIWYAMRARDFFFFALTNPGIETGGFFGESKSSILKHIPPSCKPGTFLLKKTTDVSALDQVFAQSGLTFPVIAKPEVGERGWLIRKIHTADELKTYVSEHPIDIILQRYVDLPLEVSIMAYSLPDGSGAGVTSICEKHFLQIAGDGTHSIGQLILQQDRAVLHYEKLRDRFSDRWEEVLPAGEKLILEQVGNHCRGTMFLNRNDQIDPAITGVILGLLGSMPGVHYGRFDMRVGSWASLRQGKDIRVLEFNGASADPAHIYQPGYSLLKAYADMAFHWKIMYRIARQNKRLGHPPAGFVKIISALILYFRYKRSI